MPNSSAFLHRGFARLFPLGAVVAFALSPVAAHADPLSLTGIASTTVTTNYQSGGMFSDPSISATTVLSVPNPLSTSGASGSVVYEIRAPDGYQINLFPTGNSSLSVLTYYNSGPSNTGLSYAGSATVSFTNLTGTAPTFTSFGSLGYTDHAYFSQVFSASISSPISFTAITFTTPLSGTGNNTTVSLTESARMSMQDSSYFGASNAVLMSITPIPEPGTYALFAGLAAGACILIRRRQRAKAA
jgi:hypothetical protein